MFSGLVYAARKRKTKFGTLALSGVLTSFRFISREDVVFGLLGSDSPQAPQNWCQELKF